MFLGSLFSQINLALPVVNTLCAFALERTIPVSVLSGGFLSCAVDFDLLFFFFLVGEAGSCLYILEERDGVSSLCLLVSRRQF